MSRHKLAHGARLRGLITVAAALAGLLVGLGPTAVLAGPSPAASCVSSWYYSSKGTQSWVLLRKDTNGLPLSALQFSRTYSDPLDASGGFLDFNKDGKSDIFAALKLKSGKYEWVYSSDGIGPWTPLAVENVAPANVRFGDFDADGYTDVFFTKKRSGGGLQWYYLSGYDLMEYQLAHDATPLKNLRFGDFNGDGTTDVFSSKSLGNGHYAWRVSYGGTASWVQVNTSSAPLSSLHFGDVDNDGRTDVVTDTPGAGGQWYWYYSSRASGAANLFAVSSHSLNQVRLAGDFNHDGATDFFYTTRTGHTFQWNYYYYQSSAGFRTNPLAYAATPPANLRFADFNGDRFTDVFKLVRSC